MAWNGLDPEETPPLSRSDLWMRRGIGIGVLLIGAALVYSLVFTQFDLRVQFQWEVTEDGERVPLTHITCPSPWSAVVEGAEPEGVVTGDLCVSPSRTLWVEGVIVAVMALAIGLFCLTWTDRPRPLEDIPWSVRRLRWERLRRSSR